MAEHAPSDTVTALVPAAAREAWFRLSAALNSIGAVPCRTSDPEAWFADPGTAEARMAADACSVCDARVPCLAYALAARERHGIWAATTPAEREAMRDRRPAA
ncbi:WhiB family transcriptional regulator [Geodermatophilus marinus]|uniref:WhiB family transcriptional regulator n=1 Tax=Geodermatophilus sp. LHW52908 TaxID=2303986 RepID=UPI001314937B|nr:WhiB family transcriptional regulator [Geodermatophilus sp. LHW52908]